MKKILADEVPATSVNGKWIGDEVQFHWAFPGSGVHCEVWGEVREVHHNPEGVTIWLAATGSDTGDKTGFTIPADELVKSFVG